MNISDQTDNPIVVTYGSQRVNFVPCGGMIERRLRSNQFYEMGFLLYIEELALRGVYIDAGSRVGTHALFFASFCPAVQVFALEPRKRLFDLLTDNVNANNAANKIVTCPFGLSDREETALAELDEELVSFPCRPLDPLIDTPVSMMRIDLEGIEHRVLSGAERILREYKPIVFLKAHTQRDLERNADLLARYGYILTGRVFNSSPTYELMCPSSPVAGAKQMLHRTSLLEPEMWAATDNSALSVKWSEGMLCGTTRIADDSRCYLSHDTDSFDQCVRQQHLQLGDGEGSIYLQCTGDKSKGVRIAVNIIEYNEQGGRTDSLRLDWEARMFHRLELRSDTRFLRLAFRLAGAGKFSFSNISLHRHKQKKV